jgi:hypothetical protein
MKNVSHCSKGRKVEIVGGKDAGDGTRNAIRRIMSDSLACQFSWAGKSEKRAFKSTKVCRLLMGNIFFMFEFLSIFPINF